MCDTNEQCRRCQNKFGPDHQPNKHYPHLCQSCVDTAIRELAEAEAALEDQALKYDLWERCPEI